jgi:RNA polymerase sigma-70 factor (ECF subfamily)
MHGDATLRLGEARLVEAARRGDRAAFAVLVHDAAPMLERLALRVLRHRQDAEDAAQEAILDAWRNLPRFRGDARFRTWTYRILIARAMDVARRRRPVEELPEAVACSASGPAESAASNDVERAIREVIDDLPPAQRAVLLLRTDHGMSYEEIAYVMGTGRDAVRVNLVEARRKLARKLKGIVDLGGDREARP